MIRGLTHPVLALSSRRRVARRCRGGGGRCRADAATSVIRVDGSSTVFPSPRRSPRSSRRSHPARRVTVGSSGTGGGFQKFCRYEFIELPIAYDGLAVVVNPKNTWAPSMTVAELKKLWEPAAQGKITRWNQVPRRLARPRDPPVRRRRRLGHVRLLHRGDRRQGEGEPRRLHVERGRQRPRPGRRRRRARARLLRLRLLRGEQGQAEAGADRRWQCRPTARARSLPSPETVATAPTGRCRGRSSSTSSTKALDRPEVKKFVEFYLKQGHCSSRGRLRAARPTSEHELVRERGHEQGRPARCSRATTARARPSNSCSAQTQPIAGAARPIACRVRSSSGRCSLRPRSRSSSPPASSRCSLVETVGLPARGPDHRVPVRHRLDAALLRQALRRAAARRRHVAGLARSRWPWRCRRGLLTAIYLSEYAPPPASAASSSRSSRSSPACRRSSTATSRCCSSRRCCSGFVPGLAGFNALSPGIVMGIMILPLVSSLSRGRAAQRAERPA